MSTEQIQSFAHGTGGAIVAAFIGSLMFKWSVKKWSRWIPVKCGEKGRARLLREQNTTIRIAKALCVVGICVALLCYKSGWLNDHDWRGLGLGVGLMSLLSIGYIVAANVMSGPEAIKEAMVAFAISEKLPTGWLIGFMTLCFVGSLLSAISLLLQR